MRFLTKKIIEKMELMEILRQVQKKGFAVKQYHTIEKGVPQQYKVKIFTKNRTIDNIYVN